MKNFMCPLFVILGMLLISFGFVLSVASLFDAFGLVYDVWTPIVFGVCLILSGGAIVFIGVGDYLE